MHYFSESYLILRHQQQIPSKLNRLGYLEVDDNGSPNRAEKNFPVIQN